MSWPKVALGELVQPISKWNPSSDAPDEYLSYIDIASVDQERKQVVGHQRVLGAEAPSRARQLVEQGDVLVSTVRPNLNAVAFVGSEHQGATASTGFSVLRASPKKLDGRFLYHWSKHPRFIEMLTKRATGQSYPAVSDKIIKETEIPLPPLEEQKRIAAILDKADELRRLRRRAIERLDTLAQSIFYDMFGDPASNPKGLIKKALGELLKVRSGDGLTAKQMDPEGTFPVYGGNGISGYHSDFMFEDRKIIIGRVGVYCGAIHYSEPESWITDNALYVREKSDAVLDLYLLAALKWANLNQYAGKSSQPLVSGNRIYPVEILVPPISDQQKYSALIAEAKTQMTACNSSHTYLESLFASLQQRAFRGEL